MSAPTTYAMVSDEDGEWMGVYIDGQLVDEGHDYNIYRILKEIADRTGATVSEYEMTYEWLEENNFSLPPKFPAADAALAAG